VLAVDVSGQNAPHMSGNGAASGLLLIGSGLILGFHDVSLSGAALQTRPRSFRFLDFRIALGCGWRFRRRTKTAAASLPDSAALEARPDAPNRQSFGFLRRSVGQAIYVANASLVCADAF